MVTVQPRLLLEPLVHMLEPLLNARAKDGSQHGALTLSMLLTAASLANACSKGTAAKKGRPASASVQSQTSARRVKALLTTLRTSPRKDEKERSLSDLAQLVKQEPHLLVAAALDEGVAPLVEMADCGSLKAKEQAAGLLRQVASSEAGRSAVARAGGIAPLVKLVAGQARPPRLEATGALAALACAHPANQDAIAASGALTQLLRTPAGDGTPAVASPRTDARRGWPWPHARS